MSPPPHFVAVCCPTYDTVLLSVIQPQIQENREQCDSLNRGEGNFVLHSLLLSVIPPMTQSCCIVFQP